MLYLASPAKNPNENQKKQKLNFPTVFSKMFYQPNQEVTDILKQEKRFIEDKRPTRR